MLHIKLLVLMQRSSKGA